MKKLLFLISLFFLGLFPAKTFSVFGDTVTYKPFGKLVDIGGYKLHINCSGRGGPAVVLISGASNFSFDWLLVQEKLSTSMRVCSYDRPGLAWSDPGPMPRSIAQDEYELHQLLKMAKINPPLLLVGHSLGGIIARMYARQYPDEIAGMVLVDATSENNILFFNGKIERLRLLASEGKQVPPIKTSVDTLIKLPPAKQVDLWLKPKA